MEESVILLVEDEAFVRDLIRYILETDFSIKPRFGPESYPQISEAVREQTSPLTGAANSLSLSIQA